MTDPDLRDEADRLRREAGGHWMNRRMLAEEYGFAESTVLSWFRKGQLPNPYRRKKSLYVWSADLADWQSPERNLYD